MVSLAGGVSWFYAHLPDGRTLDEQQFFPNILNPNFNCTNYEFEHTHSNNNDDNNINDDDNNIGDDNIGEDVYGKCSLV